MTKSIGVRAEDGQALDDCLRAELVRSRLPAIVATVVHNGRVVWSGAAGTLDGQVGPPATSDSQFRIGSITKTFIAVEVLRMRDEGLLALNDPVGHYLPEVGFGQVSLAQLLTHTSGLQAETNGPWWERVQGGSWQELLSSSPILVHDPGTRFHYSNVGFAVLGQLVTRLRHRGWFEAVSDGILGPLGMTNTTLRPRAGSALGLSVHPDADYLHREPEFDAGAMASAGQLWCSINDLGRWARFVAGDTDGVLNRTTLEEMSVPLAVDDRPGQPWSTAQGLGWRVWSGGGRRQVGHGGSMPGFLAVLKSEPTTGLGVAVMTNSTSGLGPVADELLELVRAKLPTAEVSANPNAASDVEPLLGVWFWGPARYTVRPTGGGFHLSDDAGNRQSRFVRDGDHWRGLDNYFAGERLVNSADGTLHLASFVLSRQPYDPSVDYPGGLDGRGWFPR